MKKETISNNELPIDTASERLGRFTANFLLADFLDPKRVYTVDGIATVLGIGRRIINDTSAKDLELFLKDKYVRKIVNYSLKPAFMQRVKDFKNVKKKVGNAGGIFLVSRNSIKWNEEGLRAQSIDALKEIEYHLIETVNINP